MKITLAIAAMLVVGLGPTARASAGWLIPPVDAPLVRGFDPPASTYGRGHRGVDYAAAAGTAVRAAGAGTVTFAGPVAGRLVVAISHDGGLETTYSFLSELYVRMGQRVEQGRWLGRVGSAHPGLDDGLHFGVKLDGEYVDPTAHLGPLDPSRALHLAPLREESECVVLRDLERARAAPNDNVAVAIAGIGSHTRGTLSADMYEYGPELLGYPEDRIYRFSYRGNDGPDLHEPYDGTDTYKDLRAAAGSLRDLLMKVADLHPGADIDLIAHSQGGIVARTFLEGLVNGWDPSLPRIAHLVTLATPHAGAPLADAVEDIDHETLTGSLLLDGLSAWAKDGGPLPDPRSEAVEQLAPSSDLIEWLATEDVLYGTRALALAMPHDAVVPADRAQLAEETNRVVAPEGVNAHAAIVRSSQARAIAHSFLRDAAPSCPTQWDHVGPWAGRAISWLEERAGRGYAAVEGAVVGPVGPAAWVGRAAARLVRASDPRRW
jgi:hypothetical protein